MVGVLGGGFHLRFENKHASWRKAVKDAFEEALDAFIAPVEVNPFCGAEAHDYRVAGISVSCINEVFPPKTAIIRKHEGVNSAAVALPRIRLSGRRRRPACIFGHLSQMRSSAPEEQKLNKIRRIREGNRFGESKDRGGAGG